MSPFSSLRTSTAFATVCPPTKLIAEVSGRAVAAPGNGRASGTTTPCPGLSGSVTVRLPKTVCQGSATCSFNLASGRDPVVVVAGNGPGVAGLPGVIEPGRGVRRQARLDHLVPQQVRVGGGVHADPALGVGTHQRQVGGVHARTEVQRRRRRQVPAAGEDPQVTVRARVDSRQRRHDRLVGRRHLEGGGAAGDDPGGITQPSPGIDESIRLMRLDVGSGIGGVPHHVGVCGGEHTDLAAAISLRDREHRRGRLGAVLNVGGQRPRPVARPDRGPAGVSGTHDGEVADDGLSRRGDRDGTLGNAGMSFWLGAPTRPATRGPLQAGAQR